MLTVQFGIVTLSKAAKYLMLLLANSETVAIHLARKGPTSPSGLLILSSNRYK